MQCYIIFDTFVLRKYINQNLKKADIYWIGLVISIPDGCHWYFLWCFIFEGVFDFLSVHVVHIVQLALFIKVTTNKSAYLFLF